MTSVAGADISLRFKFQASKTLWVFSSYQKQSAQSPEVGYNMQQKSVFPSLSFGIHDRMPSSRLTRIISAIRFIFFKSKLRVQKLNHVITGEFLAFLLDV